MTAAPYEFYIYDLETTVNCFTFSGKFYGAAEIHTFEISTRKNDRDQLKNWLSHLQNRKAVMVGFNNLGFDYPIIHTLMNEPYTFDFTRAYLLCQQIITSQNDGQNRLNHFNVGVKDRIIPQVDLFKLNHFDNRAKTTSLKSLQFALRLPNVEDIPMAYGEPLSFDQMDSLILYNHNDVKATEEFLRRCIHLIEFRKELLDSGALEGDVLNYSDVKIGSEFLVKKIGRQKCYTGSKPKQTLREYIAFKDIVLPQISYRTDAFQEVVEWFKKQTYWIASDQPSPSYEAQLAGVHFYFGIGGVHASVESKVFESNAEYIIKDLDVTSMYPSVAIANKFAPEHLGEVFEYAYSQLVTDRNSYKKGTAMNKTLKLASNGAFGNSDNPYSPFYDPRFPKQITINGQLQILMLAELMSLIQGVQIIQANTDGITIYLPRKHIAFFEVWKADWEKVTKLKLEEVEYSKMWIRDVNNYLCVSTSGKIKAKGAYWYPKIDDDYDGNWNKDFSMMVVQKVIEQALIKNIDPKALVKVMSDPFDFMMRYKTPAGATVYIGDKPQSKTVRYYVSKTGQKMKKISKPKGIPGHFKRKNGLDENFYQRILTEIGGGQNWDARIHTKNKTKYDQVETSIESGWLVRECNRAENFNWQDVNYDYYLKEIEKLYIGVRHG